MLILFVALLAGPLVVARLKISLPSIPMQLMQPTGLNNNDTLSSPTGRRKEGGSGAISTADATSGSNNLLKMRF